MYSTHMGHPPAAQLVVLQEEQAKQEAETKKAAEDSEEEDDEGRVYLAERIADFFDRPALASIKPYVQVTCSASCCLGAS